MDDVIIFSKSVTDHIKHVEDVLTLFGAAGISLKLKKCELFQRRVNYLGHVILQRKLAIAKDSTKGIRNTEFPKNLTKFPSFLGACNVYRSFIKSYGKVAYPLYQMITKDANPDWEDATDDQIAAFCALKE